MYVCMHACMHVCVYACRSATVRILFRFSSACLCTCECSVRVCMCSSAGWCACALHVCEGSKGQDTREIRFENHHKTWEGVDLGNCPKRENLQKWLGEGAKGRSLTLLGPGSKGLPRVFCTTQTLFCTGAIPFCTSARGLLLAGSKRAFAPSPNHFRELSLFGQFPWKP